MSDVVSKSHVHYDPTGIKLVRETTLQSFVEPALQMVGGAANLPQEIVQRVRNQPSEWIAPLLEAMTDGDTLWFCQSEVLGPLFGHKGIALVRDERPVIYLRLIDF